MSIGLPTFLLRSLAKDPSQVSSEGEGPTWEADAPLTRLQEQFPSFETSIRDATVVDFGCGNGHQSVALVNAGARHVIGLDTNPAMIEAATATVREHGVADRVTVTDAIRDGSQFDVLISQNSMEHFTEPAEIMALWAKLVRPGGKVFLTFGPPWYAPWGAHMGYFAPIPWVQLFFSEKAIMSVRAQYRHDGATRYRDVEGGLGELSVRKFEKLLRWAEQWFRVEEKRYDCIKRIDALAKVPVARELFINIVSVVLTRR